MIRARTNLSAQPRSSTERYLRGKVIPGQVSPVQAVIKLPGGSRLVVLDNGTRMTLGGREMTRAFQSTLKAYQKAAMTNTIHSKDDGTVTAQIGGMELGKARKYKSRGSAMDAIKQHYSQKATEGRNLAREQRTASATRTFKQRLEENRARNRQQYGK